VPDNKRVSGAHIASYADAMQKADPAKYAAYFSQYLAEALLRRSSPSTLRRRRNGSRKR
jgi:hypothetical protein